MQTCCCEVEFPKTMGQHKRIMFLSAASSNLIIQTRTIKILGSLSIIAADGRSFVNNLNGIFACRVRTSLTLKWFITRN